jgi:8-oxo-dGTP pyrophosphatase MutT (NUDIX family)
VNNKKSLPNEGTFYILVCMVHILDAEETFFVATKLCLRCEGKILTLFESYPWLPLWRDLPGGKISKSERTEDIYFTLSREIREELGLNIVFHSGNTTLFSVEKIYEMTTKWEVRPFIFLCFLYEIESFPTLTLEEHSSYEWIEKDDIELFSDWRKWFDHIVNKAFTL